MESKSKIESKMKKHLLVFALLILSPYLSATTINWTWTGSSYGSASGTFTYDSALDGTGIITADDIDTFTMDRFWDGSLIGSWDLADGTTGRGFRISFDTNSTQIVLGGIPPFDPTGDWDDNFSPSFGNTDTYNSLSCGNLNCAFGVGFHGDLRPISESSQFTTVRATLPLVLQIPGGLDQECTALGSHQFSTSVEIGLPDGDAVAFVDWYLNGQLIQGGVNTELLIDGQLGLNQVRAEVGTALGWTGSVQAEVSIGDETAPVIEAFFVDVKTGEPVNVISNRDDAEVYLDVFDVCDAEPEVEVIVGIPAINGSAVTANTFKKSEKVSVAVEGIAENVELKVIATDSAGNVSSGGASILIER